MRDGRWTVQGHTEIKTTEAQINPWSATDSCTRVRSWRALLPSLCTRSTPPLRHLALDRHVMLLCAAAALLAALVGVGVVLIGAVPNTFRRSTCR